MGLLFCVLSFIYVRYRSVVNKKFLQSMSNTFVRKNRISKIKEFILLSRNTFVAKNLKNLMFENYSAGKSAAIALLTILLRGLLLIMLY